MNFKEALLGMRRAGKLAAQVLDYITPYVKEGETTEKLNALCNEYILKYNATPAPLEQGFPKAICTSVNDVVCHGIPDEKKLIEGDILNIDVSLKLNGWHGDTSRMFTIGKISKKAQILIDITYAALWKGIETVKHGNCISEIGKEIENYVHSKKFFVVKQYCGHGIGKNLHEPPMILHHKHEGEKIAMHEGMFFTIEPMVNEKSEDTILDRTDNWTVRTKDGGLSAQFEHTLAVTKDGFEILT